MSQSDLIKWGLNPQFITPDFLAAVNCTPTLPSRFVKKVIKSNDCWRWIWGTNKYPTINRGKRGAHVIGAHVASYILHFGPVPDGCEVCHTCDNPCCVRPDHLFAGTRQDNMDDAVRKGRAGNKRNHHRGSKHHNHKLTASAVRKLRKLRESKMTYDEIARHLGVSKSCVAFVLQGRTWLHITSDQISS